MSDKAKVYQGVRVKMTVREMLQRQRAEAKRTSRTNPVEPRGEPVPLIPNSCPPLSLPFPADLRNLPLPYPASDPVQDGPCSGHMQDLNAFNNNSFHQHWDVTAQSNTDPSIQLLQPLYQQQPPQNYSLPPTPKHGLSSDVDYYGPGMLWSPEDLNSHSPHDSFSSSSSTSSSSCYDSPSRMESSFCSPEPQHFQPHFSAQDSYMSHVWTNPQNSFSTPEYAPYYSGMDFSLPCPVDDSVYRRDLTTELCYNAL